jgi:hypothetical protein
MVHDIHPAASARRRNGQSRCVTNIQIQPASILVRSFNRPESEGRAIRRGSTAGVHVRLRRGFYADNDRWKGATRRDRHLAHVRAVVESRLAPPVIGHESAAVLWGFPLVETWPRAVHVIADPSSHARSKNGVVVHRELLEPEDVVEIDGMLVTRPLRTLLDLARAARFSTAVAAMDFALNPKRATAGLRVSSEALLTRLDSLDGGRGLVRAERAIRFARPLVDNPGETLSRIAIDALGFPEPELQLRHVNPRGGYYFTDFEWPHFCRIGEFDGRGKYLKPEYLREMSPGDAVYEEKIREDHLRAEGNGVARWGVPELRKPELLGGILLRAGLPRIRAPRV